MFNERNNQLDQAYIEIVRNTTDSSQKLAKSLIEIIKELKKIWGIEQEKNKVAVKVGEDTFNLLEDKDNPDAYKWEKVDLTNDGQSTTNENDIKLENLQYNAEIEQIFTDYQVQTLATKLISDAPGSEINYDDFKTENPVIQVALLTDTGSIVLYETNNEGLCIKNSITEELSLEKIIDIAYEPLSDILPPNSPLLLPPGKDNIETKVENTSTISFTTSADDMLSQVVSNSEVESRYDVDGLLIDDIQNITTAKNSNEILPIKTEGIEAENVSNNKQLIESNADSLVTEAANTNIVSDNTEVDYTQQSSEFDADGLVVEEVSVIQQPNILITNEPDIEITNEPIIDSVETNPVEVSNTDALVLTETNEIIDYSPPEFDAIGFDDIDISNPPEFDGSPDDEYDEIVADNNNQYVTNQSQSNEQLPVTQPNEAHFIAGTTARELGINNNIENLQQIVSDETDELTAVKKPNTQVVEESSPIVKRKNTQVGEEPAANYTYRQVASSPEVEPRAQQWARQSTIPVYEIKHRGERERVKFEENKSVANAATEMLKKYGTVENDGSRIYRSDAFAIRKEDGVISIHRRSDEAKGFKEPLMQFKLDSKGVPDIKGASLLNNLKGNVTQNDILPIEKQEFLIVAERIGEGKGLPDLQSGDVREMGNALGSLAPAGTLRTLETFKKSEMLEMLNSTLNQTKSDEVKTGEFTIKRERDPENNRASLVLTKDGDDGRGKQELVRFNLEKTPDGIKTEVAKMNISDYDIGQIKHIAQNAYKLDNKNLESNFDSGNNPPQPQSTNPTQPKATVEDTKTIGDIPVNIHPWIAKEWQKMAAETKDKPLWQDVMQQDNDELLQKLEANAGKLPISDQREMYDKIIMHKVTQVQASGDKDAEVSFMPKKDITADLMNERSRTINSQFTPTTTIPQRQAQPKRETPRPVKQSQGVEL